jgi:hypothetical protein
MMLGREGEDITHALDALSLEEERFQVVGRGFGVIFGLILLDGAVVIHKGKCLFIFRVRVASGSWISGT